MTQQCYLAVDLGAESGRVIAGLVEGDQVRLEELHRFSNGPVTVGGSMRWDVLRLWSEIQNGLAKAAEKYRDAIVSVGVDTWGVDYVLMSATDEILCQPSHYRDARTRGLLADALARVPKQQIFAETGTQFMEINTLYQLLAMQKANGPILDLADRLLLMPDFFHWCLSGSRVVEFTNATTTQCFHPTRREWSQSLLQKFGLRTDLFPDVVSPGTTLGKLRADVADRCGLPRINVVAPATHDTGSAVAAVPTTKTGTAEWAYLSSGTWSLLGVEVPDAILTERALAFNVTNEGGIDGTYRLLKNIMGLWLVQKCRQSFQKRGHDLGYDELARLASEAEPFRSLIDPDDARFLNPDDMPSAIQSYCLETDQPEPKTEGQLVRCALESLALKYRTVLGQLEELTGTPVQVIHIVGGGSRNELLNQFAANACGCPVIAGPVEATALGNVLVQARAAGQLDSLEDIRNVVRCSTKPKEYEPRETDRWNDAWERFSQWTTSPPV